MKFAILGAGLYGRALGNVLTSNGHGVVFYDPKLPETSLNKALSFANTIIVAAPSSAVPELLKKIPADRTLIIATKGLLSQKYFEKFSDWMIMSGPSFAEDINQGREVFFTISDKKIEKWFKRDHIFFDYTDDKYGILLCGALKNIYAIYAGYKQLKQDSPRIRKFYREVIDEMSYILKLNGADPDTARLACGISDLILTCSSRSRNYTFGSLLKKNPESKPEVTVEGLSSFKSLKTNLIIPESARILNKIIKLGKKWA